MFTIIMEIVLKWLFVPLKMAASYNWADSVPTPLKTYLQPIRVFSQNTPNSSTSATTSTTTVLKHFKRTVES